LSAARPPLLPRQPTRPGPLLGPLLLRARAVRALPRHWLFGERSQRDGNLGRLLRAARYPYALLRDLARGQINLHAMGLVYASLLSIIPLVALSLGVLKALGAEEALRPLIHEFLKPMGRAADPFTDHVMTFARGVHGGLVGSLGLGVLIWTLLGTMRKVEDGFNFVWHVDVPRSFARRSAEYITLLLGLPMVLAALTTFWRMASSSTPVRMIETVPLAELLQGWSLRLAPYLLLCALMTALYVVIPNTHVRLRPALYGGVTAGIIWALVGRFFTLFVLYSARLTLVYAGFAIMIAALLWTYFSWITLLLGAQLSFYVQNPGFLLEGQREPRLSSTELERLALGIMYLVAQRAVAGGPPLTIEALSLALEFPGGAVTRTGDALIAAGYLGSEGSTLQLKQDAAHISVLAILHCARNQRSGFTRSASATPAPVEAICRQFDRSSAQPLSGTMLADLLPPR
jgi:membrane protein